MNLCETETFPVPMRKPDWLLVLVGMLIGAAAGLFFSLLETPVHVYMASHPQFDHDVLYVDLFGSHWFKRSAPRPEDLRVEMYIWGLSPLLVLTPAGLLCGWVGSKLLNRRALAQSQVASTL